MITMRARPTATQTTGCRVCGNLACVCGIKTRHAVTCLFRKAAASGCAVECIHGMDVCPECDPCTCGAGITQEDFR